MGIDPTRNYFARSNPPILSATLHYFRVPRENWELHLLRLRQLGANTISTPINWRWHEPEEGTFDFSGRTNPQRNLIGFVRLCRSLGMRVLLQPGPIIGAETLGGGIPAWLLANYPDLLAQRSDGEFWRDQASNATRLTYDHPKVLSLVRNWYYKVAQALGDQQWPWGPIIALQVDNATPGKGWRPWDSPTVPMVDRTLRGDYNEYVLKERWPKWLENRYQAIEALNLDWETKYTDFESVRFPYYWSEPVVLQDLRYWQAVNQFTEDYFHDAIQSYARMLRAVGWEVPIYHNWTEAPWQSEGLSVNLHRLAQSVDWVACQGPIDSPKQRQFETYVQHAYWRPNLAKHYSPDFPSFICEVTQVDDFSLIGNLEALNLGQGVQSLPEPDEIGVWPGWGLKAPIRPDGSVEVTFWRAKGLLTYLTMASSDVNELGSTRAEVAIGYSHLPEQLWYWGHQEHNRFQFITDVINGADISVRGQEIAQAFVEAKIDFDVIDLDMATLDEMARYAVVVIPSTPILSEAVQDKLITHLERRRRILWVGGIKPHYNEYLEETTRLQEIFETNSFLLRCAPVVVANTTDSILERGSRPSRYAWVDSSNVDVTVHYAPDKRAFLTVVNRRDTPYEGVVHYLAPETGRIYTAEVKVGAGQVSFAAFQQGKPYAVLLQAESQPRLHARGIDFVTDHGLAVMAFSGEHLVCLAAESTQLQLYQYQGGWLTAHLWRLTLDGSLWALTDRFEDNNFLSFSYVTEDQHGETDMYLLAPAGAALRGPLREYFDSLLVAQAVFIERAIELGNRLLRQPHLPAEIKHRLGDSFPSFDEAGNALRTQRSAASYTLSQYANTRKLALDSLRGPVQSLSLGLRQLRTEAALTPDYAPDAALLNELLQVLGSFGGVTDFFEGNHQYA